MISLRSWPRRRAVPVLAMAAIAASATGTPVEAGATAPSSIRCSTKPIQPSIAGDSNALVGVAVKSGCNALAVGTDGPRAPDVQARPAGPARLIPTSA